MGALKRGVSIMFNSISAHARVLPDLTVEHKGRAKALAPKKEKPAETDHEKVMRMMREGQVEGAARHASRLINANDIDGFLIYSGPALRKAEEWFADTVSATKRAASSAIGTITPHVAQVMLSNNPGNRTVNAGNLGRLMRDIDGGRWKMNGEPIIISREGFLNDGQHRLWATLLTGGTIKSFMSFGVERETRATVDIGKKREAKDRLRISGETEHIAKAAIAGLAFEIEHGRQGTPAEIDDYFDDNANEIRAALKAKGSNITGVGPAAMGVAAMHLLSLGADPDSINMFFRTVRSNENTKSGNAARTIHMALYPISRSQPRLKLKRTEWVSTLCHHYIRWVRGTKTTATIIGQPLPEAL